MSLVAITSVFTNDDDFFLFFFGCYKKINLRFLTYPKNSKSTPVFFSSWAQPPEDGLKFGGNSNFSLRLKFERFATKLVAVAALPW